LRGFRVTNSNDSALQPIEDFKVALDVFLVSVDNIETHTARLLDEAGISVGHLLRLRENAEISMFYLIHLEERLTDLHIVSHREKKDLMVAQEDVLAELWTLLGGNRKELRKIAASLDLLKNVDRYRKDALAHIMATLQTLYMLDADMEELRLRVVALDIVEASR
jgi:hypothetical protein